MPPRDALCPAWLPPSAPGMLDQRRFTLDCDLFTLRDDRLRLLRNVLGTSLRSWLLVSPGRIQRFVRRLRANNREMLNPARMA
jgi:hypothetical protein